MIKKLIMEFLGTFFLVLAVALTGNPLAIAIMLMAWIYIGSPISGAHYNPIISLAMALRRRLSWDLLPWYIGSQVVAGIAAYALASTLKHAIQIPHPGIGVNLVHAGFVELLLSMIFALVALCTATLRRYESNNLAGAVIGLTIIPLAVIGSPISGGLFNPAIALGATIFGTLRRLPVSWENLLMYLVGAFLGSILAAYLFKYFYETPDRSL